MTPSFILLSIVFLVIGLHPPAAPLRREEPTGGISAPPRTGVRMQRFATFRNAFSFRFSALSHAEGLFARPSRLLFFSCPSSFLVLFHQLFPSLYPVFDSCQQFSLLVFFIARELLAPQRFKGHVGFAHEDPISREADRRRKSLRAQDLGKSALPGRGARKRR